MIIRPTVGQNTWIAYAVGPMARDALAAIGRPSDVTEIAIVQVGDDYTLNMEPVAKADADLVWNAWRCDPKRFAEDASQRLIAHMRRAIIIRKLLGGTAA